MNPYQVVKDFETGLCKYTGAPFAVTTTSCTMALLLACAWHIQKARATWTPIMAGSLRLGEELDAMHIEIPRRTYIGVPMSIIHAGGRPTFRDEEWRGIYQLKPLPVWDSARWFSKGMYSGDGAQFSGAPLPLAHYGKGQMVCVSFHWSKTLGIQQGGAILHDDPIADEWLRLVRFDGRAEGVAPKDQAAWPVLGWHCYMSPEVAAEGLMRLSLLPKHNDPLPNDAYPDLSLLEIFR